MDELVTSAERIVKKLSTRVNEGQIGLQGEQQIVEFVNWIGNLTVEEMADAVHRRRGAPQQELATMHSPGPCRSLTTTTRLDIWPSSAACCPFLP